MSRYVISPHVTFLTTLIVIYLLYLLFVCCPCFFGYINITVIYIRCACHLGAGFLKDVFLGGQQTTGCRWTGITLSKQQLEEAVKRVKAAGLADRITLLFCDYR